MKKSHFLLSLFMVMCVAAAAWGSVAGAKPLPPAVMRGVLYMTSNVEAAPLSPTPGDQSPQEPVSVPEPQAPAAVSVERLTATVPPSSQGLEVSNLAKAKFDIDELLSLPPETAGAQVLILHTHGCEAYTPTPENNYASGTDYRTTDKSLNVVRVGDEIQKELEAAGVSVIHDTTLCDEKDFNKSYATSLSVAEKHLKENPGIKVILDVHRDSMAGHKKTSGPDGASQLMFVVGTDMGGLEHPLWRQNLSFALNLQRLMVDRHPGIMRPINLRTSRFNQHLSTGSIIVEVGSDGNTLEEALAAAKIFGRELGAYITGRHTTT